MYIWVTTSAKLGLCAYLSKQHRSREDYLHMFSQEMARKILCGEHMCPVDLFWVCWMAVPKRRKKDEAVFAPHYLK